MIPKKYSLKKGILIAIEGIDGAGKTTQTARLKEYYSRYGISVSTFKEPTDGIFGQEIRKLALNGRHVVTPEQELELFIRDRIEDCENNILPALNNKHLVIIDRYYFSSIAYQGALGIDIKYIQNRNEEIAIKPDLVIILDVAAHIGLSRISNFRKETHNHFEGEDYLEKVRNIFCNLKLPYVQTINASRDEDDVFKNIKNMIMDILIPYTYMKDDQFKIFEVKRSEDSVKIIFE